VEVPSRYLLPLSLGETSPASRPGWSYRLGKGASAAVLATPLSRALPLEGEMEVIQRTANTDAPAYLSLAPRLAWLSTRPSTAREPWVRR